MQVSNTEARHIFLDSEDCANILQELQELMNGGRLPITAKPLNIYLLFSSADDFVAVWVTLSDPANGIIWVFSTPDWESTVLTDGGWGRLSQLLPGVRPIKYEYYGAFNGWKRVCEGVFTPT